MDVRFCVKQQENFDGIVLSVLRELADVYPHISCNVVLERLPGKRDDPAVISHKLCSLRDWEFVRLASLFSWRNEWMLKLRQTRVVTYVTHGWVVQLSSPRKLKRQGKTVIGLA